MRQLPNYRRIEVWVAVGALVFMLLLIEAIRRRRLKERYALLWVLTVIVVVVLTLKREWLDGMSFALGIHHAPSALLLVLVGFAMVMLFHFSTVLSRLLDDRNKLAQQVGILDARCRALALEVAALHDEREPAEAREDAGRGEGCVEERPESAPRRHPGGTET